MNWFASIILASKLVQLSDSTGVPLHTVEGEYKVAREYASRLEAADPGVAQRAGYQSGIADTL